MSIFFCFAVHSHQPVGNFDFVLEDVYQKAYLPFLKLLERYPSFRTTLHYSGSLLEWLEKHHPEFFELLRSLVKQNQIELLTGGMYEPILPAIPDRDKIGQIQKLSAYLNKHFGVAPKGAWITERVWEPQLPKPLAAAGVEYVILDDTHFKYAGLTDDRLTGYYITDEEDYSVKLFPISKALRYAIPFQPVEKTLQILQEAELQHQPEEKVLLCYADDGEKFGAWPDTHKHCYQDGWLKKFLTAITSSSAGEPPSSVNLITILPFGEAAKKLTAKGRIYLPTAAYAEMLHWALPPDSFQKLEQFERELKDRGLADEYSIFVRGGFWRNFLAKYPEANNLHKKMLWVRKKVEQAENKAKIQPRTKKTSKTAVARAWDELYQGQCNCPYWHGVFGGLYLNHLRGAAYQHLLQAETIVDPALHRTGDWSDIHEVDFDCDGHKEILVETPDLNLFFAPQSGGMLFEFDLKSKWINLLNTMTRRPEGYHYKILPATNPSVEDPARSTNSSVVSIHDRIQTREKGLEKHLTYDWYRRTAFIDHFLGSPCTLEDFALARYPEQGDFVNQPYQVLHRKTAEGVAITFSRNGGVWVAEQWLPVRVMKTFQLVDSANRRPRPSAGGQTYGIKIARKQNDSDRDVSVAVTYQITNLSDFRAFFWFGVECNFALSTSKSTERYYLINNEKPASANFNSVGESNAVKKVAFIDEGLPLKIEFTLEPTATLWRFPVETVSISEAGFEKVYQNSIIFPHYQFALDPKKTQKLAFTLIIT